MAKLADIRIGTSGWIYRHWRGIFYPQKLAVKHWFDFYARHFDTVEINNTFYRLPPAQTFLEWRQQAPKGFVYAVKSSRFLTHLKKLKDAADPLEKMLGRARHLGPRLGPILYQLPPHWHCDPARLRQFVSLLPPGLDHVFEFRDSSWCNAEVQTLLKQAGMNFCIHDMHGFDCPLWVTGPLVYIRFHGPGDICYSGRYSLSHLRGWAKRIKTFRRSCRRIYVYFNNDVGGHALVNARELKGLLA